MSLIREGVVVSGEYLGWKVLVDDDRDGGSGGYYLYLSKGLDESFDYWFEFEMSLETQLSDFDIVWVG